MGVNGIYGLSGSGLDIESMVKVGMMSRQSQYDKMQQTYTKNEWTKAAYVDIYNQVNTFNTSTLSQYKMSANMNARGAKSSSDMITATANANAASMTHHVTVNNSATNAYLISDSTLTRYDNSSASTQLKDSLMSGVSKNGVGTLVFFNDENGNTEQKNSSEVAFKFAVGDGATGSFTNSKESVATVNASAGALSGSHTLNITRLADNVSLTSGSLSYDNLSNLAFVTSSRDETTSSTTVTNLAGNQITVADSDAATTNALEFTLSDGENTKTVSLTYSDVLNFGATMQKTLADKINAKGLNITAAYDTDTKTFSLTNNKEGSANTISITAADETTNKFLDSLSLTNSITGNTETYDSGTATVSAGQDAAGTFNGSAVSFSGNSASYQGYSITAESTGTTTLTFEPKTVSVTYGQLADGYSFNDLTADINNLGLNVKASYDSVNDKFSFYNTVSGKDNKVDFYMGASGDGGELATKFFNALGLKKSENGELADTAQTYSVGAGTSISGSNASVKIDGASYDVSDNKLTVGGVTYDFTGATKGTTGTVTVTQDTDKIIENVKSFIDSYNTLLKSLTDAYNEKPNKNYKPLTDSQKEQMKDEQIEKWEEKAKAGMLYHDQTLGKLIDDMRSSMSSRVMGISGSYDNIFSLGISTTGTKGQLTLDEDKLKAALSADPNSVYNVFATLDKGHTYTTSSGRTVTETDRHEYNGVAQRLGDVFYSNLKNIKSVSGSDLTTNDDSDLSKLMRDLQTRMSNFKKMMDSFEDKLYKKYDKMETVLSSMGVQLNYVTMAFG